MPRVACAIFGCTNGTWKLRDVKKETCNIHQMRKGLCGCVPFKHYPFPKDPELRRRWKHLVNRQKSDKDKTLWSPKKGSVICSDHFKDGEPTNKNPCPTLHIGYKSFMPSLSLRKRKLSENTTALPLPTSEQSDNTEPETGSEVVNELIGQKSDQGEEPENWLAVDQLDCTIVENKVPKDNSTRIMRLKKEIRYWKKKSFSDCQQLRETKKQLEKHTKSLRQKLLQNDQKCEFYTGISSLAIYSALCEYTTSFMSANKAALPKRKSYYYTTKRRRFISPTPSKPTNDGLPKNLQHEDCILLTLMKLRLGLLHADLANRFGISTKEVSLVFKCYIEILAKSLRPALLIFYTRQEIARTIPKEYGNYPKLRCIIDCSEIFIQKPSHMRLQAATWSDYKHHNTVKFLVAISPQGSIAFISKLWGGRTSDRHIVRSSGFLSHLNPQDQVLADRGFTVREELMMRGAELVLPPAGKGKAQMTPADVAKTKKVANVRIHVERVIQRIKTFRLISQVLPISLLSHADHIVTVCCALTNLKGPIVKQWNQVSE